MRNLFIKALLVAASAGIALIGCGGGGASGDLATPVGQVRQATWHRAQNDMVEPGVESFSPAIKTLNKQTLRQIAHITVGGTAIKVKLSNVFGTTPLAIDRVTVARSAGGSSIALGSSSELRFNVSVRRTPFLPRLT